MLVALCVVLQFPKMLVLDYIEPNFVVSVVEATGKPQVVASITDDSYFTSFMPRATIAISPLNDKFIIVTPRHMTATRCVEINEFTIQGKFIQGSHVRIWPFDTEKEYLFGYEVNEVPAVICKSGETFERWDAADHKFSVIQASDLKNHVKEYLRELVKSDGAGKILMAYGPRWASLNEVSLTDDKSRVAMTDDRLNWTATVGMETIVSKNGKVKTFKIPENVRWFQTRLLEFPWVVYSVISNRITSPGSSGGDRESDIYMSNLETNETRRICKGIMAIPIETNVKQ